MVLLLVASNLIASRLFQSRGIPRDMVCRAYERKCTSELPICIQAKIIFEIQRLNRLEEGRAIVLLERERFLIGIWSEGYEPSMFEKKLTRC